ncbi:monovalent cation:H+ antiporter-2, CPA2 family [Ensifer adhaerens]|nr:monovalent cation:H+ antiporter-2, CPA2 family [Ensifer adhaerens]
MTNAHSLFEEALILLGGAVVASPIFKKLGLGTVLGYLAAGVVIGPVMHLIRGAEDILGVAELGVVFLLFVIGLELKPSRLWQMRKDIFGLGTLQVGLSGGALTAICIVTGLLDWQGALIAGFGLALSSTAFAMQILEDNGDRSTKHGQRTFSLLLFQDLAIVPLLALIPLLARQQGDVAAPDRLQNFAIAIGVIVAVLVAGRYLLNPLFQVIARTGAREAMIAAALFVVMAAAVTVELAGLSMAMGSFLAGVMLSESTFRHELEADIEPFRGILLGLFFMAVGMSLDLQVIEQNWILVLIAVPTVMIVKALTIYVACRITGSSHNDAVKIGGLLQQGGEFGFVLFSAATAAFLFPPSTASLLIATVTLTMAATPLGVALVTFLLRDGPVEELDEDFEGAGSDVLIIGFSRFGQVAAQVLLASGRDVTIIDHSADRIRQAANFGFRIYFGDGTRKDVLRSAGVERAKIVAVCTQKMEITDRIVDLVLDEFPQTRLFVRAYDRVHLLSLQARGIDYGERETFEGGLKFGAKTLEGLGVDETTAVELADETRERDYARLALQASEGIAAGRDLVYYKRPVSPEPLVKPRKREEQD